MQFISLHDIVEITPAEVFSFWCDDDTINNMDNLSVKAYLALNKLTPVPPVAIRLYKRVPYMSGMGSASADCAAVLTGLNTLFDLQIPIADLLAVGKTLGADVPACVIGGTVLCEGIGEQMTPIQHDTPLYFNIIMPPVAFSTPDMYRKIDQNRLFSTYPHHDQMVTAIQSGDIATIAQSFYNDFVPVATPSECITDNLNILSDAGALGGSMTGAGSAVFGIFTNETDSKNSYDKLLATGLQVYHTWAI